MAEGTPQGARARDLGIRIGTLAPGRWNAITDVAGVHVGHTTLIQGSGPLVIGQGPVRTGVTMVVPRAGNPGDDPLFAGSHVLNGDGEMTGLIYIAEKGLLATPVGITNTHSVGVVRDAIIAYDVEHGTRAYTNTWSLPVVAETYDGFLSDINGFHVQPDHVFAALDTATTGPVAEGNVGGGTGMICHGFKGGIGTSSRVLPPDKGGWTTGVLVQANYGSRARLTIDGVPVGRALPASEIPTPRAAPPADAGSIIVIVATDAPLLPMQCRRMAQRASLGIARVGGVGGDSSGDIFLAFSTGNQGLYADPAADGTLSARFLPNNAMSDLFEAVVDATEEAIVNALCAATTMTGINDRVAYALPHDRVQEIMRSYGRLEA